MAHNPHQKKESKVKQSRKKTIHRDMEGGSTPHRQLKNMIKSRAGRFL